MIPQAQISPAEEAYVSKKAANSIGLWGEYLTRVNIPGLDVESLLFQATSEGGVAGKSLPNFGFAVSGGGLRALCNGASVFEAMDGRNSKGLEAKVGGLVQLANYATGLSG